MSTTTELLKKAVLVDLSISIFPNQKEDKALTAFTIAEKSLQGNAGKWKKNKLNPETLDAIQKVAGQARVWTHYRLTLPWNKGYRLLTTKLQSQYESEMKAFREQFNGLVDTFIEKYPDYVNEAKVMHNGSFNADDYPHQLAIRDKFAFTLEYAPVPAENHFIADLAGAKIEEMRQSFVTATERRIQEAISDTWEKLLAPVKALSEKMTENKPVFRDSLVGNIKEVLDVMDGLNVTGDTELAKAAKEIAEVLKGIDADSLRASPILRAETGEKTAALLNTFGKFGRKFA